MQAFYFRLTMKSSDVKTIKCELNHSNVIEDPIFSTSGP